MEPERLRKRKVSTAISFERPPMAEELFDDEFKKKFNASPGWQRQLIKRTIETGSLSEAAKESGAADQVREEISSKELKERNLKKNLQQVGLTSDYFAAQLKECIEAKVMIKDKNGNIQHFKDPRQTLKALELWAKIAGFFDQANQSPGTPAIELFEDVKLDD